MRPYPLERRDRGETARVALVSAPAGYDETTLVDPQVGTVLWFSYPFAGGVVRRYERRQKAEEASYVVR